MTTTITVKAHPALGKQVRVKNSRVEEDTILQDGQQQDFYAYDDIVIIVDEEDIPVASEATTEKPAVNIGGDGPSL